MNTNESNEQPQTIIASSSVENKLASRWARLGAGIMDGIIVGIPFWIYIALSDGWMETARRISESSALMVAWVFAGFLLFVLINGFWIKQSGQTIGKKAFDIKVVDLNNNVLPLSRYLLIRTLPFQLVGYLPYVGGLISLLDILFIFRADKRCIHDLAAGTRVVNA